LTEKDEVNGKFKVLHNKNFLISIGHLVLLESDI